MVTEVRRRARSSVWTALAVFAGVFLVVAVAFIARRHGDWASVYVPAAQRLQAGEPLVGTAYAYPPAFAWLILPLAWLPALPSQLLWALVNTVAGVVALRAAWSVSGGQHLTTEAGQDRRSWKLVLAVGLIIAGPFLLDVLTNQQNDLVLAALVLGGCALLVRRRDIAAGCVLGLAAGIKCTPLLWAPYLLLRRRYLSACVLVLVALGINLVPDLTHPPADGVPRLVAWAEGYLRPMTEPDHAPGDWCTAIYHNHSLGALTNRLLTQVPHFTGGKVSASPRADAITPATLKRIVTVLSAGLLLAAVFAGWMVQRTLTVEQQREKQSLEFGLVLCLMLFLSPASSKPHFGILLLPALALACALCRGQGGTAVFVGIACAAGLCCNKDLVGARIYGWVLWYGGVVVVNAAVYLGCLSQLLRLARQGTAAVPVIEPTARERAA